MSPNFMSFLNCILYTLALHQRTDMWCRDGGILTVSEHCIAVLVFVLCTNSVQGERDITFHTRHVGHNEEEEEREGEVKREGTVQTSLV